MFTLYLKKHTIITLLRSKIPTAKAGG